MNIRQNVREFITHALHLTLPHMLADGLATLVIALVTALFGTAYLWLRNPDDYLLAAGALATVDAVLLAFVFRISRRNWRRRPITPQLGGGEEREHAIERDGRDVRKLSRVHLHVDGDANDVRQLIEEFNSTNRTVHTANQYSSTTVFGTGLVVPSEPTSLRCTRRIHPVLEHGSSSAHFQLPKACLSRQPRQHGGESSLSRASAQASSSRPSTSKQSSTRLVAGARLGHPWISRP